MGDKWNKSIGKTIQLTMGSPQIHCCPWTVSGVLSSWLTFVYLMYLWYFLLLPFGKQIEPYLFNEKIVFNQAWIYAWLLSFQQFKRNELPKSGCTKYHADYILNPHIIWKINLGQSKNVPSVKNFHVLTAAPPRRNSCVIQCGNLKIFLCKKS